jgi:formylglycine-generating enzyme
MNSLLRQWCLDFHDAEYYKKSPVNDPLGPPAGGARVLRGNDNHPNIFSRSASRYGNGAFARRSAYGFRVVCEIGK